jgi:heparanase 1
MINLQTMAQSGPIDPAQLKPLGTIDVRFQSYNVEMLEVTGGNFWKPYSEISKQGSGPANSENSNGSTPNGMDPNLYQYRAPKDLTNPRLRKLAAALGPAYIRVSGTWANSTFFQEEGAAAPKTPPPGFNGVLTRAQWKGVVDFSKVADARIVTSFATSPGTRDASGLWTSKEADKFLAYNSSVGGDIAAAEFMNEPTFASMGGAPKGYDGPAYGRDIAVFKPYLNEKAPAIVVLGPGSVGEGGTMVVPGNMLLPSHDLLQASGPVFDAFSYHFYGAASNRCAKAMPGLGTTEQAALSREWLSQTDDVEAFYEGLRDKYEPGKPLWITETADSTCGVNPWASSFLDSFRYLNQLGSMARHHVQVVLHNTLASSDYGLLDEKTYAPRPNYWAAYLWRHFMGTTVFVAPLSPSPNVYVYAHCLRGVPGGVALLAINADRGSSHDVDLSVPGQRYTLSSSQLQGKTVALNGVELQLGSGDSLPKLKGSSFAAGSISFAPATISFITIPGENNAACK